MRKRVTRALVQIAFYLLIALIALYLLFPLYWAVATALKTDAEAIAAPATWFSHHLTFEHFQIVANNGILMRSVLNSFGWFFCIFCTWQVALSL
jgi:ABC-type glycerol-3-phosphate transport system permease component